MKGSRKHPVIRIKRVYEPPAVADGKRVLVDRLWPRGITKHKADIHAWLKELAPSAGLRKWFGHDPARWKEFQKRYHAELNDLPERLAELRSLAAGGTITLVYAAKDEQHNNAESLRSYLMQ